MVTKLEELKNIRAGLGELDLAQVPEDSKARQSKIQKWFELGGLESPSEQSIELSSHIAFFLLYNSRQNPTNEPWIVCSFTR